jgi:predicted CXXCH cytochrome family protein
VARTRTTKQLAQRIDLSYFKRPSPMKRTVALLSAALPMLAIVWLIWHFARRDDRVYSSGMLSAAHAVLDSNCAACHVRTAGAFSAKVTNSACLSCHDGPLHHAEQSFTPDCTSCHTEHRGRISLTATSNASCSRCHEDLDAHGGRRRFASGIHSFEDGHPEFAALRPAQQDGPTSHAASDPGSIKLNHALHMRPILTGPNGPQVQLTCGDCHRPAAAQTTWKYADASYVAAKVSYAAAAEALPLPKNALPSFVPPSGREHMAPVLFATACAGCHLLAFDKRFREGAPHDQPEVVHEFVAAKFREYIAAYPQELREAREPGRELTSRPVLAAERTLRPSEWVAEHTVAAETLLWRKTCVQCHALETQAGAVLPQIAPARTVVNWLPHAKFSHDAHTGFSCESCHTKAASSTESRDVLIPGIATCQTCHAPGSSHAEARCFECHTYHDWSQRKEAQASFTLPALASQAP